MGETFRAPISHKTHNGNGIVESYIGHRINVGPVRDEALGDHVDSVLLDDQFAYCLSTNATIDGYRDTWEPKVTEIALARSTELQQQLGRGDKPERSISGRIVRPVQRRNSSFSKRVHRAYDHTCAVCGQRWKDDNGHFEVEAAHIYPVSGVSEDDPLEGGPDSVKNGMALCRTHHWAFDHGWFTINDDYTISVKDDPSLEGYEAMAPYEGQQLYLPNDQSLWPARHYVTFHREHVWTG
ncbi:restriction endonuclease-like protein [Halorubrum lipolyticum DSM 21995]|uniref:Restriction endonuclease-like protein n=1 Tax=Halorubrum lipolyticum DSM 21995 TaxID=1227482 RepID=M0P7B4_9EURY|nr:restriction endonuclease-like protein [Halorubrum lipolyticum DSM 21995]